MLRTVKLFGMCHVYAQMACNCFKAESLFLILSAIYGGFLVKPVLKECFLHIGNK